MDRSTLEATEAAPEDAERAVATITLAFAADPVARWSLGDAAGFLRHFPAIVSAFGGRAFEHGSAHQVGGFAGSALWLPPGVDADEEALAAIFEEAVGVELKNDVYAVLEQMEQNHPAEPCWYLPMIGVDPRRQGQGLGSVLLRHALDRCDRDGLPAYLESSNPANVSLYERHGFESTGVIQAGSSPPIRAMLRKPR
ncbi:GNAT family N-acetyltransferase [Hansschlegelia zhihuaiae]|uniref:GNAT family N-acetyltransferase n=1 Tax=Hansschlegelia zhihuaiae TaxID=405005 RepID=A0A4Q0MHY6_9HYPH|nr:N-acetyltransferase [Hansschlegelia zhihuaiae]RXF73025.1 GNAT family N-acetyltransferase [Hansschlegelia zhihuaiae]